MIKKITHNNWRAVNIGTYYKNAYLLLSYSMTKFVLYVSYKQLIYLITMTNLCYHINVKKKIKQKKMRLLLLTSGIVYLLI